MKKTEAWVSEDGKILSLQKSDVGQYEAELARTAKISKYINENLSIMPQDDLKTVITEFILQNNTLFDLTSIWNECQYKEEGNTPPTKIDINEVF